MKKYIGNVIQGIAGFGVMLLLWCIGAISYHYSFADFEFYFNSIFYYLPNIVIVAMPVFLLVFAFIGKRYNFKVLYFSALLGVWLPILAYICSVFYKANISVLYRRKIYDILSLR